MGEEVRVSTPVMTASCMVKPLICRSKTGSASRMAATAKSGRQSSRSAGRHARLVGRHHGAERRRWAAGQEVADQLGRRRICAAAGLERATLPVALEGDAGERMARVVGGRDADDDAGVGVALVARILAHAVGDDAAGLGGRRHDRAAGTHAEAVDRAAVARVMHELVVGSAKDLIAGIGAEPAMIDQRLRMLDAHTDRERLGLDVRHRVRGASEMCRGRCGRRRARRDRPQCVRRSRARRHASGACRRSATSMSATLALEAILAAQCFDRSRGGFPPSSQGGRCRYGVWRR